MKLTQDVIDQIQEAMNHTKMNGDMNWLDAVSYTHLRAHET